MLFNGINKILTTQTEQPCIFLPAFASNLPAPSEIKYCYVGLQSKLWGVDAMPAVRASCRIGSVPGAVVKAVPRDASSVWEWR